MGIMLGPGVGLGASGVTGTIEDDGQVTIAWDGVNGFGATGPSLDVFDDFRTGPDDAVIALDDAEVGTWTVSTSVAAHSPKYTDAEARSKGFSFSGFGPHDDFPSPSTYHRRGIKKLFTDTNEFFISYAIKIPNWHPGALASRGESQQEFPDISAWKVVWVSDSDGLDPPVNAGTTVDGRTDVIYLSNIGRRAGGTPGQRFIASISGNDGNIPWDLNAFNTNLDEDDPAAWGFSDTGWWSWSEWMRYSFWVKADLTDADVNAGDAYYQVVTLGHGMEEGATSGEPVFNGSNSETVNFAQFNAFFQPSEEAMTFFMDDFYLATGAGAAARVEIGNNATYSSCSDLAMCTINSWSNTSISCTLRAGAFADFTNLYIHIHDADNNYVGTSRLIS